MLLKETPKHVEQMFGAQFLNISEAALTTFTLELVFPRVSSGQGPWPRRGRCTDANREVQQRNIRAPRPRQPIVTFNHGVDVGQYIAAYRENFGLAPRAGGQQ